MIVLVHLIEYERTPKYSSACWTVGILIVISTRRRSSKEGNFCRFHIGWLHGLFICFRRDAAVQNVLVMADEIDRIAICNPTLEVNHEVVTGNFHVIS